LMPGLVFERTKEAGPSPTQGHRGVFSKSAQQPKGEAHEVELENLDCRDYKS
jgi:hypothetical protein